MVFVTGTTTKKPPLYRAQVSMDRDNRIVRTYTEYIHNHA